MKEVRWHGSSRSDVDAFPKDARREAGYQLFQVQVGEDPSDWKPMTSIGPSVREIRIRQASGAYRIIYLTTIGDRCPRTACLPEENTSDSQAGR
jgi:phage-related protein